DRMTDYSTTLNINWGFSLPKEAQYSEIYCLESEVSFLGDGIRYHVFSCENPEPINEMFSWQTEESGTRLYVSYSEVCSEWLSQIDVPLEEYPDYAACLYWHQQGRQEDDRDEIILFWNENTGVLYVVEFFL
ncbi:MAG: hypothetical protein LUH19_02425, partial [Lachnospiraceae bacterium]|nr:hypothetical protein [Lachnospiraceae bacterium]